MSMKFFDENRPHPNIELLISTNNTPLSIIPFPDTKIENYSFLELLGSERFKQIIENVKKYNNDFKMSEINGLISHMMSSHYEILKYESNKTEYLEKLAVDLILNEFGIDPNDIEIEAKITGHVPYDTSDFNFNNKTTDKFIEVTEEEDNEEIDLEQLKLECSKRRLINSLIQGSSKKGHYMFHLVENELINITRNPYITKLYGSMMSINDFIYWINSEEQMDRMLDMGSIAGKIKVLNPSNEEGNEGKVKIIAHGMNFAVLLHELVKGIMEVISLWGLPENENLRNKVIESEDSLYKEIWDLRLGPVIWDIFRNQLPDEVLLEDDKSLLNFILMELYCLPANEFLSFMKVILSNTEKGKKELIKFVENIKNPKSFDEDLLETDSYYFENEDGINYDELKNELKDLGIDLSDDSDL